MKFSSEIINNSDLDGKTFVGEVVDNNDPEHSFRCKIRVFGLFDELKSDEIPFFYPSSNLVFASGDGFGSGSVPKIGSLVRVRFLNGDLYQGEYYSLQDVNSDLKNEISNDYENAHVLLYDKEVDLKILFLKNSGIVVFHKGSYIKIHKDSKIEIFHNNEESKIILEGSNINIESQNSINITTNQKVFVKANEVHLDGLNSTKLGPTANFSAVGSEPLWSFLKALASVVDSKYPPTPGAMSSLAETTEKISTSQNVKVSVP